MIFIYFRYIIILIIIEVILLNIFIYKIDFVIFKWYVKKKGTCLTVLYKIGLNCFPVNYDDYKKQIFFRYF